MILRLKDVSKEFLQASTKIQALAGIDLSLESGKTMAIVGPSGSGKTTLLSLLAGLDRPSTGEIEIADRSIGNLSEKELADFRAQNLGIVFQQFHLMPHLTAGENVSLPLEILGRSGIPDQVNTALTRVGLSERVTHRPNQLSGGECQRVAIARAMVVQPKILLADEPSGNLDTATGTNVMDLLFDLVKEQEMTMVLVTHDPKLADRCDHQIHLAGGRIQ